MSSNLLLSETDSVSSRSTANHNELPASNGSIKDKLEEFSAKLNQLQLVQDNSDERINEDDSVHSTYSAGDGSSLSSKMDSSLEPKRACPLDSSPVDITLEQRPYPLQKITARFQPIGSIKPIHPKVCQISSDQPFSAIVRFLCKKLKLDGVHCYINNAFAPSPDQSLGELWTQFNVNNELIISYCETVAFG